MSDWALVVEDDPSWLDLLSELLEEAGLEVEAAVTREDAVDRLKARAHLLAVVDLSLSRSDHHNQEGLQVLEAVRRHNPLCRAVLLTGYATVELAVQAITRFGAVTCLRKESFSRSEFRALVSESLAAPSAPPSPSLPEPDSAGPLALVVDDDAG